MRLGFDWLKVWVFGASSTHAKLCDTLEQMKERAQHENRPATFTVAGRMGSVQPAGFGKGAYILPFVMKINGAVLAFTDGRKEKRGKREIPVMCVEFPGRYCYGRSMLGLCEEVHQWAKAWGFKDIRTAVSRVDITADAYGRDVVDSDICRMHGGVCSRANKGGLDWIRKRTNGLRYGTTKSEIRFTIYDKLAELETDEEKRKVFFHSYPEAAKFKNITRHEWSLTREYLRKKHDIDSLVDLMLVIRDLWRYLSFSWYREVDPTSNPRIERCEMTPFWQAFHRSGLEQLGPETLGEQKRRDRPKAEPDPNALIKQALGCLKSVAAIRGCEVDSTKDLLSLALFENGEVENVRAEVKQRFDELRAAGRQWREEMKRRADLALSLFEKEHGLDDLNAVPF